MKESDKKKPKQKKKTEVKTFCVPYSLGEIKNNISIPAKNPSKYLIKKIFNQAFKFHSQGNILAAAKYYQFVIDQGLNDHRVFSNYGVILKNLDKLQDAELSTHKAIKIKPDFAVAHSNLGNILRDLGKLKEAELSTRKAIKIKPDFADAFLNLGNILKDISNLKEAEKAYRKAIKIKPDFADAYSNLGNILKAIGNLKEAEKAYRKAIIIKPDFADAHLNLGNIFRDINNLKEAKVSLVKAIQLKPDFAEAHSSMGHVLSDFSQYYDAIDFYKEAIRLDSNLSSAKLGLIISKGNICDWRNQDIQTNWLDDLGIEGSSVNPLCLFYYEDNPSKHLKRAEKFFQEKYNKIPKIIAPLNNKKIRIGYFSSDFRRHPTMYLISSILKLHDKSKFEIYLYSFAPKEDKYTEIAKKSGCIFKNIRELTDMESVELARKDKIDIAIDLMGYIQYNRMNIFSYRVAPIQINYLGYPGSIGSDSIDYIISDKIITPNQYDKYFSEKIIRMPNCYQCNDNTKEICKEPISREEFNLPKKGFVFTCFNANKKITPKEFNIWMKLLLSIKGSVLWLYKSNNDATKNLMNEAEKSNVDPNRLIFANHLPLKKHLARHSLGDLALDTFNYNGHTTTSDALWAGLPVLTKIGESFAARVSASILTSIGLPDLITFNEKEYEEKAINIAQNPNELKRIKTKLAQLRDISPLYNSEVFTRNLEYKLEELVR